MKALRLTLTSKVMWIFIAALIVLGALAWGFSKPWRGPWRDQLPKVAWINLRAHLTNVVKEIGSDPTSNESQELLRSLRLQLRVKRANGADLETHAGLPPWNLIESEVKKEEERWMERPKSMKSRLGDFVVGRAGGRMFAVLEKDGDYFTFFVAGRNEFQGGLRAFSGFVFTIAFLLIAILLLTSWLVRPMKSLISGVNAISEGKLDTRVPVEAKGEFGRLAESFNKMADRIQSQLKSKDRLLMDVSHELRSPLGRIKMAAEMLKDNRLQPDLQQQIQSDVREMEDLITELLDLYRLQGGGANGLGHGSHPKTEISVEDLFKQTMAPLLEAKPGLRYEIHGGETKVRLDVKSTVRAFRNVIENAQKFSKHQSRPVEVRVRTVDGFVEVEVEDFGIGMSPEESARVFEPFYRSDTSRVRETGGYGLGLSLSRAILQSGGGDLELVRTELGRGSLFRLRCKIS